MFFFCFYVFFRPSQNTRQPFLGTAERIFLTLLTNDSRETSFQRRIEMGAPNTKKTQTHNTRYPLTERRLSVVRANVAWCRCMRMQ